MKKEPSLSKQHWNGCQMCVIDIETTGTDPHFHEMIQLCVMPLTANLEIRRDVMPFYIEMIPDHPLRADKVAMTKNRLDFTKISLKGFDREAAKDLFEDWMKKLKIPYTKFNVPCRIIPLGHNYGFDRAFLMRWLGDSLYHDWFHPQYRDTLQVGAFLNDRASEHAEVVPYSKLTLNWLCHKNGVSNEGAHNALIDCQRTALLYQKLIRGGLFI